LVIFKQILLKIIHFEDEDLQRFSKKVDLINLMDVRFAKEKLRGCANLLTDFSYGFSVF
jgi:hypothetical protein